MSKSKDNRRWPATSSSVPPNLSAINSIEGVIPSLRVGIKASQGSTGLLMGRRRVRVLAGKLLDYAREAGGGSRDSNGIGEVNYFSVASASCWVWGLIASRTCCTESLAADPFQWGELRA